MRFRQDDLTLTLITLLGSLSLVDVVTTTFLLEQGGRELNRFLVPFVHDPALFMAIKAFGILLILMLAGISRLAMKRGDHVVLATCCGVSILPAVWNTSLLWGL
jgi:hypothetical protein